MNTLLCFGFGYTANAVARILTPPEWRVIGTTRDPAKAAEITQHRAHAGVTPIVWSDTAALEDAISHTHALLISTPPTRQSPHDANAPAVCPALAQMRRTAPARHHHVSWIGYLSTNGVYGDHDGRWVDEATEPAPTSARGQQRLAAENAWLEFGRDRSIPTMIFRLPGIYGPNRSALDTVRAGTAKRIVKDGQVFSRAHVDDIAATIVAGLNTSNANRSAAPGDASAIADGPHGTNIFNVADDEPAPPQDVIDYACRLLHVAPPPLTPIAEAEISDMARSFYADNKRVRNQKIKTELGVTLKYPTFRDGLTAIYENEN